MLKPMLAATIEKVEELRFPLLASPKLDGIRCLIVGGVAMSRNMKPIPNLFIREQLAGLPAFDGELIVGDAMASDCFNRSTSGVMSRDGTPEFMYHIFDMHDNKTGFKSRLGEARGHYSKRSKLARKHLDIVPHLTMETQAQLLTFEQDMLKVGFEGVMVRDPHGPYKMGRATLREGWLSKLKRFADGEAVVIGWVEQEANGNEAKKDELGRTKRSSAKAGKTGKDTLGALKVRDLVTKVEFEIGTGFNDAQRDAIWALRGEALLGRVAKYKHQPVGQVVKPRFPVFLGWRSLADL